MYNMRCLATNTTRQVLPRIRIQRSWSSVFVGRKILGNNKIRAKTEFPLPFSHSGRTKTNSNANLWLLLLDQISSSFQYALVYTQATQIWREKGTKQIKYLFWRFQNLLHRAY